MRARYLEVTFRKGRPLAAYLYLPRASGVRSARTQEVAPGLLADFAADGDVIGVEFTAPASVTVDHVNAVLGQLGVPPLTPEELAPLQAA
jgi:hypothetical protein